MTPSVNEYDVTELVMVVSGLLAISGVVRVNEPLMLLDVLGPVDGKSLDVKTCPEYVYVTSALTGSAYAPASRRHNDASDTLKKTF